MKDFETLEAVVKFETLVRGAGWWIPEKPDMNTLRWLNAWLGPHWILVQQGKGIAIFREGGIVYQGSLSAFGDSQAAINHRVDMKMLSDGSGFAEYLFEMAMDLAQTLQTSITTSLSSEEIQRRVRTFFQYHQLKATEWLGE